MLLKAFLLSSILAKCSAHLNVLDLIMLTILRDNEDFSTPQSDPTWSQEQEVNNDTYWLMQYQKYIVYWFAMCYNICLCQ